MRGNCGGERTKGAGKLRVMGSTGAGKLRRRGPGGAGVGGCEDVRVRVKSPMTGLTKDLQIDVGVHSIVAVIPFSIFVYITFFFKCEREKKK